MGKPRVLIVDDDAMNLSILQILLGGEYELISATSGEDAVAKAVEHQPDLTLLDVMMPGIDGYETCKRLRALPELRRMPVILVSAKAMPSERLRGFEAGADDYVTKPFDHDELCAKVRVFIGMERRGAA
ncbi:MAG: response regulator [Candidatus Eisenbacteria bacterium]|nr:response regulator [Candidatus Eisenbacteria bacterium]MCC7144119.1 response regulator [Candidatus Eisenbacteria bacterium]